MDAHDNLITCFNIYDVKKVLNYSCGHPRSSGSNFASSISDNDDPSVRVKTKFLWQQQQAVLT